MANPPPFPTEMEACRRPLDIATNGACGTEGAAVADNGVENSDSDSEDLGPETAVDVDDIDAESRHSEPAAPTPPADTGMYFYPLCQPKDVHCWTEAPPAGDLPTFILSRVFYTYYYCYPGLLLTFSKIETDSCCI